MSGIFPSDSPPGQRTVRDWYGPNVLTREFDIGPGEPTHLPALNVINAVFRTLNAVKFARLRNEISAIQENNTIAFFNTAWPQDPDATDIDEAIAFCPNKIRVAANVAAVTFLAKIDFWIDGMFAP